MVNLASDKTAKERRDLVRALSPLSLTWPVGKSSFFAYSLRFVLVDDVALQWIISCFSLVVAK